jgi:hypothetical protein
MQQRVSVATVPLTVAAILLLATGVWAQATRSLDPARLAGVWDSEHVKLPPAPLLTHAEVDERLRALVEATPDLFSLEEIGKSVEGRSIHHLWFGDGPFRVLLWSQMHGDEPTATSALFDMYEFFRRHREDPAVKRMLEELTIHTVPMLNPDGAERLQRRNSQGIDINRDALRLQTPEGRALKALRDRLEPQIGFNLHNQGWRTSVGRTGRPASISLLAVAFDEEGNDDEGRILAKKLCAVIRDAIEPFAEGQIGRYDDELEVRAFGDNITKWGTNVVLIETGAWPSSPPDPPLVRLNFIALVSALDALATGSALKADPMRYESLPMNGSNVFYRLVRNATIIAGTGIGPFIGDVGIGASRAVRVSDGERRLQLSTRIDDIGDLHVFGGLEVIDATGLTLVPLDGEPRIGDRVRLPEDGRFGDGRKIAVGEPADLVLLRPDGEGSYLVERVIGPSLVVEATIPSNR